MFLIDAQLPPVLKDVFAESGVQSIHVLEILLGDETPDKAISEFADAENLIVVTKDSDFSYSHTLRKSPKKLLLITTGNIKNKQLCQLIRENARNLVTLFEYNTFVELSNQGLVVRE